MKQSQSILDRLPELPVELFELSAKLGYSDSLPVITNIPTRITGERPKLPVKAAAGPVKAVYKKHWFGWITYPKVVCHYVPEPLPTALAFKNVVPEHGGIFDLGAIADTRRFYRLTRFEGADLAFGWICQVRYGPWFVKVREEEQCVGSSIWYLDASDPEIHLSWWGTWEDRPEMTNLQVIVDINGIAQLEGPTCCEGSYCATTMSCIPSGVTCMDQHPV